MATIKSYTDIEQSRKLEEILLLESADMSIGNYVGKSGKVDGTNIHYYPKGESFGAPEIIHAWSLAALLSVLEHPRCFQGDKPTYWFCGCFGKDKLYHEVEADNPVDACYELILTLHKLKLL